MLRSHGGIKGTGYFFPCRGNVNLYRGLLPRVGPGQGIDLGKERCKIGAI